MRLWISLLLCRVLVSCPRRRAPQQPTRILQIPVPAGGNVDLSVRILVDSLKDESFSSRTAPAPV